MAGMPADQPVSLEEVFQACPGAPCLQGLCRQEYEMPHEKQGDACMSLPVGHACWIACCARRPHLTLDLVS